MDPKSPPGRRHPDPPRPDTDAHDLQDEDIDEGSPSRHSTEEDAENLQDEDLAERREDQTDERDGSTESDRRF
jgi:hypothetical protein